MLLYIITTDKSTNIFYIAKDDYTTSQISVWSIRKRERIHINTL